ncbi:hypothetical protein IMSHALPRED_010547 [Imshaugia aleurites]|uniref:Uncharacterized protein n=1 Tax=Imshaugia aleurites TaxID=172621 RepID=A0A8H3ES60_9LECA|nr:hypothetical protein IMSHALPRED_010547 [Imshaugia aleurites]
MATLLILVTPCIALMAPLFISPAISILAVLALAITQIIVITFLFFRSRNMVHHDETEAVTEDATNVVHAAFAAVARDPGATTASFRVVNGVVVHRYSTAGSANGRDGSLNGTGSEEVASGKPVGLDMDKVELDSGPEHRHARENCFSSSSSRECHVASRRLGGFWVSTRGLESPDMMSQMV